jgi:hypothetical protein
MSGGLIWLWLETGGGLFRFQNLLGVAAPLKGYSGRDQLHGVSYI